MKETKNIIKFLMLVATIFILGTNIVGSIPTTLDTINYKQEKIILIPGNVTLNFTSSDTGNNDILFIWRIYSSDSDLTLYSIVSKVITYDYTFINNTKKYDYIDDNTLFEYRIMVNYSSINVPKSPQELLNDSLIENNTKILELNIEINDLNTNITFLQQQLNATRILAEQYKNDSKKWEGYVGELNARIYDYEYTLDKYMNKSRDLRLEKEILENQTLSLRNNINTLENPWHPEINLPSLFLGLFIILGGVLYFRFKKLKKPIFNKKFNETFMTKEEKTKLERIPNTPPTGLRQELKEEIKKEIEKENKPQETEKKDVKPKPIPSTAKPIVKKDFEKLHAEVDNVILKNHYNQFIEVQ